MNRGTELKLKWKESTNVHSSGNREEERRRDPFPKERKRKKEL